MRRSIRHLLLLALGLTLSASVWALGPWHASGQNTFGWPLMSPAERFEYQRHLRSLKNYEDCTAYLAEHQARMYERARAAEITLRPRPVSACEQLRQRGQLE